MSLTGKSALVTGAAGGIGGAICVEFLKNGLKNLAALDLCADEPEIVSEWRKNFPTATITYFQADVSCPEDLQKTYNAFVSSIESLDIVVNCAGFFNERARKKMIDVNFYGLVESTFLAIEHMRKDRGSGKGGVIISIASCTGLVPLSLLPTYSATKHAVVSFTRSLAFDREYMGIKFLSICPAGTKSQMYNSILDPANFYESTDAKMEILRAALVPQEAEEVGKAAVKLIGEGKSGSSWLLEGGKLTETPLPEIQL
uniref:15-hydroxyprostaglandin dehydrogenase n=2 Tax=Lutzomyia longipalpis TaxID=7200 RepID=A0A1B0CF94_LUTLO